MRNSILYRFLTYGVEGSIYRVFFYRFMAPFAITIGFQYAYDNYFCFSGEIDMKKEIEEIEDGLKECKEIQEECQRCQRELEKLLNEINNENNG